MHGLVMDDLTQQDAAVKEKEELVSQPCQQTGRETMLIPTADQMRLLVRNVTRGAEPLSVRRLTADLAITMAIGIRTDRIADNARTNRADAMGEVA